MIRKHTQKVRKLIIMVSIILIRAKQRKQKKKSHFWLHNSAVTSLMPTAIFHSPYVHLQQFNRMTIQNIDTNIDINT